MIRMMAVSAALILGMSVAKGMEGGQGASPPLLTPEQRQQRYQQLDAILGAEVPLGGVNDVWPGVSETVLVSRIVANVLLVDTSKR